MLAWIYLLCIFLPWSSEGVIPDTPPCLLRLETAFFQQEPLYQAFSFYQVPQGLWEPLYESLQAKSPSIPERMKQKTAYMVPNPIEYPLQKQATWKILKIVLYTLFEEVMHSYHISQSAIIEGVFNYLVEKQGAAIQDCLNADK